MPLKLYVIGRPNFDVTAVAEFLNSAQTSWRRTASATKAEEIIEIAGRICYMSFGSEQSKCTNGDYIRNLIEMGHESVLEHVSWSFLISGITRSISHQLVRHRVGFSVSQLSQQYHDESNARFVMPPEINDCSHAAERWMQAVNAARDAYGEILRVIKEEKEKTGITGNQKEMLRAVRSAARSVLPNCTETTLVITVNARALRHFLTLRGAIPGDCEMRELAVEILKTVQKEAPSLFFDFEIARFENGSLMVRRVEKSTK